MKDYRHGWGTLVVSLLGLLLFAGRADAVPADSLSYALITPPSSLEVGCFGPCDCAVQETPTYGSFDLIRTGADAVYTYYEIHRYIASFNNGPGAVSMIGAGTYKLDRSAGLQEMTLDLEVWGQPQHFDSGIVPVGAAFPEILAACAANAFACMDSVVLVSAKPIELVNTSPPSPRPGIQAAWPVPFRRNILIEFALDHPSPVDLRIADVTGRFVRMLADGSLFETGRRSIAWDGRTDNGQMAPAGIYWAVMRWSGGVDRRRLVKLD